MANVALWAPLGVKICLRFRTRHRLPDGIRSRLKLLSQLADVLLVVRDKPITIRVTNDQFVDGSFRRIELLIVAPKERIYLQLQHMIVRRFSGLEILNCAQVITKLDQIRKSLPFDPRMPQFNFKVGNPVERERDSGLKLNAIPL
jgi:hypothetical protein